MVKTSAKEADRTFMKHLPLFGKLVSALSSQAALVGAAAVVVGASTFIGSGTTWMPHKCMR